MQLDIRTCMLKLVIMVPLPHIKTRVAGSRPARRFERLQMSLPEGERENEGEGGGNDFSLSEQIST